MVLVPSTMNVSANKATPDLVAQLLHATIEMLPILWFVAEEENVQLQILVHVFSHKYKDIGEAQTVQFVQQTTREQVVTRNTAMLRHLALEMVSAI